MHEGGAVFQSLDEIGLHGILQKHRHRAIGLEIAGVDGLAIAGIGNDDAPEALLQIIEIVGKAEDRHDLARHRDVKPRLARKAVGHAA